MNKENPFITIASKLKTIQIIIFSLIGFLLILNLFIHSPGMPVQDEIGHFNISRNAWREPSLILDLWGRPVNTLLYMVPSAISWNAARIFSILMSLISLGISILVSKQFRSKLYFLVPLMLLFQPWFLKLSFTTLTEVPFCLFLVAGVYFFLIENYSLSSIFIGCLPLIRHEGIALVLITSLLLLIKREWKELLIIYLPYFIFNIFYFIVFRDPAFGIYLDVKPTEFYGSGSWSHFFKPLFFETGKLPLIFSILGTIILFIRWRQKAIIFILFPAYFFVHTVIYRYGLFSSGGYDIFLMPLTTGIAITAVIGLEFIYDLFGNLLKYLDLSEDLRKFNNYLYGFIIIMVTILMVFTAINVKPYDLYPEEVALKNAAQFLTQRKVSKNSVYSAHVYFRYIYDLPISNWLYMPVLEKIPKESIIVWDQHYSNRWGIPKEKLSDLSFGFIILYENEEFVTLFEKVK